MGMLVQGINGQNEQSSYTYNSLGCRVQRKQVYADGSGENCGYVVDFTSPIRRDLMVKVENEFTQSLIYANGQLVEEVTQNRTNEGGLPRLLTVHEDIMGSIRSLTTGHGDVFAEIQYDVWGKPIHSGERDINAALLERYTNHTYDPILDAYHAQCRFYDAKNRTFMSVDPIKDGLNWYGYVGGNPATWTDPLGLYYLVRERELEASYEGVLLPTGEPTGIYSIVFVNHTSTVRNLVAGIVPVPGLSLFTLLPKVNLPGDIVGGTSVDLWYDTGMEALGNILGTKAIKKIAPYINIYFPIISAAETVFSGIDDVNHDKAVKGLFDIIGWSYFGDIDDLFRHVTVVESLVAEYSDYFSGFGGCPNPPFMQDLRAFRMKDDHKRVTALLGKSGDAKNWTAAMVAEYLENQAYTARINAIREHAEKLDEELSHH
jgi:RHS repeat-associated protein